MPGGGARGGKGAKGAGGGVGRYGYRGISNSGGYEMTWEGKHGSETHGGKVAKRRSRRWACECMGRFTEIDG